MINQELPKMLSDYIGLENKDFVVKANRVEPLKKTVGQIFLGILILAFMSLFVVSFIFPMFKHPNLDITNSPMYLLNRTDSKWTFEVIGENIMPMIIISIFVFVGLFVTISGIFTLFKEGGFFVGTHTRLIVFYKNEIRSIDWEQFSGDIELSVKDLTLQLRTGKLQKVDNGNNSSGYQKFVPDYIYISDISNVIEIEQKCRLRIKENDPTPTNVL
jgi:hypothetical protein